MKKEELLVYATTWINFKNMFVERNQMQKTIHYIILFKWHVRKWQVYRCRKQMSGFLLWAQPFLIYTFPPFPFVFQWTLLIRGYSLSWLTYYLLYCFLSEVTKWSFSVFGHDVVSLWLGYSIYMVVVRIKSEKVCE